MTVSVAGVTSRNRPWRYITPDMFRAHGRRGVDVSKLVPGKGVTEAQQDAALLDFIEAGGSWCDMMIGPAVMGATMDTVQERVNVNRRGYVEVFPRYRPVLGLAEFAIGADVNSLATYTDLSSVDVQDAGFRVPAYPGLGVWSSEGPIQFGAIAAPWDQALVRYTYPNGFPVTELTEAATAGATSIEVDDTTGIIAGKTWLTIYALQNRFSFLATSVSTADAGGLGTGPGTVGCAALPSAIPVSDPLYAPLVSAMPPAAITAVVLATRACIKESGPAGQGKGQPTSGDDRAEAEDILRKLFVLDV